MNTEIFAAYAGSCLLLYTLYIGKIISSNEKLQFPALKILFRVEWVDGWLEKAISSSKLRFKLKMSFRIG